MALTSSTLSTALQTMTPTASEATARQRFADAFETYFLGAAVNGAPLVGSSISAGLSALASALVGMSATGAGPAKLAAGVNAFWTAQLSLATSMWITAPVVLVPPIVAPAGLAGLSAALTSTFNSNRAGGLTLAQACDAIAAVIHTACSGGVVPGSVPPAPPAPLPIL